MNNFILIDKNLKQNDILINSISPDSVYFNYDYSTTSDDILNFLANKNITHISRICLIFASSGFRPVNFINNSPLFTSTDSNDINFNFIINLLNTLQSTHIDFLGCNLLTYSSYKNYFQKLIDLSTNKNLLVGASSDRTGNIKYGGDWILENTKENIQEIYFNSNIINYTQLLDFNMYNNTKVFSLESLDKDINGNYIDENKDIVENRFPSGKYKIQSWGDASNGGDSRFISELGLDINITMVCSNLDGAFAALTNNGNVFVWGNPSNGGSSVYGDSTYRGWIYTGDGKYNTVGNEKLSNVVKIYSSSGAFSGAFAALTKDGNVFVWGAPSFGGSSVFNYSTYRGWIYTGDGKYNTVGNEKLSNVVKIYSTAGAFGAAFAALTKDSNVFVWGHPYTGGSSVFNDSNYRGWIYTGNGTSNNNEKLSNVDKIYSTDGAFGALTKDGNVFVWGAPNYGGSSVYGDSTYRGWIYTGDGTSSNEKLSNVVKIYSTAGAFGALTNNGNVFVWGHPEFGGSSVFINPYSNPYSNPTIPNPLPIPIDKYRGWIYTGDGPSSNEILSNVVKIYST